MLMANSWLGRDADVLLGQHELPLFAIQREDDDAVADGQHEQRGRARDRVAGGTCAGAGLQEGLFGRFRVLRSAPSGHFSTEKMVPIETLTSMFDEPSSGSKVSRYSPFGKRCGTRCGRSISRRPWRRDGRPIVGVEQDVVGQHVELFLRLALHVVAAGLAEHAAFAAQGALADGDGNGLAGAGDDFDQ